MMIYRIWRGLAKTSEADAFVRYLRDETFPRLKTLGGFVDASIVRRPVPQGIEFVVISQWKSVDSIRAFAGPNAEAAVVPPKVRDMMVEYDEVAPHYEVVP
ncbi:MAG: hypothetical protein ACRECQ_10295 [Burkholderiaceae bacterium]